MQMRAGGCDFDSGCYFPALSYYNNDFDGRLARQSLSLSLSQSFVSQLYFIPLEKEPFL